MIVFPNAKINLGLRVLEKRADGFHNIETVFYPINWLDALEVVALNNSSKMFDMSLSGLPVTGDIESNLIYKAWKLICERRQLPPIAVHLHKNIPMGAGLGGGSADAAYFIQLMQNKFELNFSEEELFSLASKLGSDCCFFLKNKALLATEKGDVFQNITINLSKYYILVVYPNILSNTKDAYQGVLPNRQTRSLLEIIKNNPIAEWKHTLTNDFEKSIFKKYPEIETLKSEMYHHGAIYASMSGSGSAVYGIFEMEPTIPVNNTYTFCLQKPSDKDL